MRLRDPLPDIFKSSSHLQVLRALLHSGIEGLTGRQLSRVTKIPTMTTHKALENLLNIGVLISKDIPPAKLYTFNTEYFLYDVIVKFLKNEDRDTSLKRIGKKLNDKCSLELISIITRY